MTKVTQENSYYGFGLTPANSPVALPTVPNKYLYNGGSEWQNDYSNLPDYYQTFYRNYDQAIGRFVSIDPQGESAESMTAYQYSGNNPIMMNDPAGNKVNPYPNAPTNSAESMDDAYASAQPLNASGGGAVAPTGATVLFELACGYGPDIIASGQSGDANFVSNFLTLQAFAYAASDAQNGTTTGLDYAFNQSGQLTSLNPNEDGRNYYTQEGPAGGVYQGALFAGAINNNNITADQAAALMTANLNGNNGNSSADQGGQSQTSSGLGLSMGFMGLEGTKLYDWFSKFNSQTGAAAWASAVSKVSELVKIGRVVGPAVFFVGEVADVVGLYNGYISTDHALGNFAAGLAGFVPVLTPFSVAYFLVDGFYPGGVGGIVQSVSSYQYEQAHANDPPPSYQNTGIEDMPGWNH